jgi:hypothetical protein
MNALEEAMNPILMGQFLLILTGMCFAAFSIAMVQYVFVNSTDRFRIINSGRGKRMYGVGISRAN